jgi:hypothetical protein
MGDIDGTYWYVAKQYGIKGPDELLEATHTDEGFMDNEHICALLRTEYGIPKNFARRQDILGCLASHLLPAAVREDHVAETHWEYFGKTTPRAPRWLIGPDGTVDSDLVDACVCTILRRLASKYYRDPQFESWDPNWIDQNGPSCPFDGAEGVPEDRGRRLDWIRSQVRAMFALLPPAQRWALCGRYVKGKTDAAMADERGCGEPAIRSFISKALKAIRAFLGVDDDLDLAPVLPEFLRDSCNPARPD